MNCQICHILGPSLGIGTKSSRNRDFPCIWSLCILGTGTLPQTLDLLLTLSNLELPDVKVQ